MSFIEALFRSFYSITYGTQLNTQIMWLMETQCSHSYKVKFKLGLLFTTMWNVPPFSSQPGSNPDFMTNVPGKYSRSTLILTRKKMNEGMTNLEH